MSAAHHVAAALHARRTRARAATAAAAPRALRSSLTYQPGDLVVDAVTGQKGTVLRGAIKHVQAKNPQGSGD